MRDICGKCSGAGCDNCNGTGWIGMGASPPSPLPKYLKKRCPVCDEEYYSDICGTCGYTSSISKRRVKAEAVIKAIEEFESSVGASSIDMTLGDFRDTFVELSNVSPRKVLYKMKGESDRIEELTE